MSAQAGLEHMAEPNAATPHMQAAAERRRAVWESAKGGAGLDRSMVAGILGGVVVAYGVLCVLVYLAVILL